MNFRLKAFGLHLLASAVALLATLGTLYLGWYYWPGWYLADVPKVVAVMIGVDLVIGPTLTLVVAAADKPRRALARDLAVIVAVQLFALVYGAVALWSGRPLYYAFSVNCLSVVQAYDIDPVELKAARDSHAAFAPYWYSLPRWIWAPLPQDAAESGKIVTSAIQGGFDVTAMPRYFKPWDQGLPELQTQLKKVDDIRFFTNVEKKALKKRMQAAGLATDLKDAIPLTGRGRPLLAVIDPKSLKITAIFEAT
jgi:hypothetical protein